jgi:CRP/FNR family nitrogen fixation transcriptional regulator
MDNPNSASNRVSSRGDRCDRSLGALEHLAVVARYEAGESVYRCNDPAGHWYRVVRGAARKSALSGDGRRHIVDFMLPGDFFGLGLCRPRDFCVEAIFPGSLIARYQRASVEQLADCDPLIAHNIRELAFETIARLQRRLVILNRSKALERVSSFLLEMADRSRIGPSHPVFLPMSRYDIADYLGLAVETVSRALTELRRRRAIVFRSARQVRICDRAALEVFAEKLAESHAHLSTNTPAALAKSVRNKTAVDLMSIKAAAARFTRISTRTR